MKRLFVVVGMMIAGAFSLAVIACAEPLLLMLRDPVHQPCASDLERDEENS